MSVNQSKLSIKKLESYLQDLDGFEEPKIQLEQYATPPHIAATLLHTIDSSFDDLDGKLVADLGCGTGRLMLGSILCGARLVYGFDVDQDALSAGLANISEVMGDDGDNNEGVQANCTDAYKGCTNFNLVQADVASFDCDSLWTPWRNFFDTVIMNPPFGTKQNAGLDMKFLKRAIELSSNCVYSLHKTSTRAVS